MRALSARLERLQQRLDEQAAALEPAPGGVLQIAALPDDPGGFRWAEQVDRLGLSGLIVPAPLSVEEWTERASQYALIQAEQARQRSAEHDE